MSDVGTVADELYGLPLDAFTDVRNERAKQARDAGDRDSAEAIRRLPKPNTVAWLANQLVRQRRDEIDPLIELGRSLREATASLDAEQLRGLSRQQHQVVHALTQQARQLAAAAGQPVSESTTRGLEDTLHAALADEQAATALATGRLTAGLSATGFPAVAATDAPSAAKARAAARATSAGDTDSADADAARRRLERAREDESEARETAEQADRERDEARDAAERAQRALHEVGRRVDRLRRELDDATAARSDAEQLEGG